MSNSLDFNKNSNWRITFRTTILIILLGLNIFELKAQITFPQGNSLNLNSGNELMYLETRILFHTGKFKASDYRWSKIYDSLDNRWFITSCFNGDCRNDLLQTGNFVTDFGIKDTMCFIAFHVETKGITGISKIRYRVYNSKLPSDSADLIYNIAYANPLKVVENRTDRVKITNPISNIIKIHNLMEQPESIILADISGRKVKQWNTFYFKSDILELPVDGSNCGFYNLTIIAKDYSIHRKIYIETP